MPDDPRTDKTQRRRHLRVLDFALAGEIADAGTLTKAELWSEVSSRTLLPAPISRAAFDEWWTYAEKRGLIVRATAGDGVSVSELGRVEMAGRWASWMGPTLIGLWRRLAGWAVPSGAIIIAALALAGHDPQLMVVLATAVVLLVLMVPFFWVGDLVDRWTSRPTHRRHERHAITFLDGQHGRVGFTTLEAADPRRLY